MRLYKGRIAFRRISKQKTVSAAIAKIDIHNYLLCLLWVTATETFFLFGKV